jgi:hypothetical protein
MLLAWKDHGVVSYAGYIIGFPGDTKETVLRDIDIIMRELPVDILEFFFLTPLPGSEDHKKLYMAKVPMDPDMNQYDLNHATTAHPKMSQAEWQETYLEAWKRYFSNAHIETVLRRAASVGIDPPRLHFMQTWFRGAIDIEGVHPLECGVFRRKVRKDRRPGLAIENPVLFYPKFAAETVIKLARWGALAATQFWIARKITRKGDAAMRAYTDIALDRSVVDDEANLDMFQTSEAKSFIAQQAKIARATKGEKVAA